MNHILYLTTIVFISLIIIGGAGAFNWFNLKTKNISIDINDLRDKQNIIPVAVIGSGPAGLNASMYTSRSGFYTVVFEGQQPGGQLTTTSYVENWPGIKKALGSKIMDENRQQAINAGAIIANDSIVKVDFSTWPRKLYTEEGKEILAAAVVIATGSKSVMLNIPGEKENFGSGVTTCALCDAPFFKNKKVVVVGGGDAAVEDATLLVPYASEVTMLVRGSKLRAVSMMQDRVKSSGKIKVLYNTEVKEIIGNGKIVTGLKLYNNETKTTSDMEIDGVFLAIGHTPNTEMFKDYIDLDKAGYINLESRTQETNLPGITSAGDVSDHIYKQAGIASGDGSKAGIDIVRFLQKLGLSQEFSKEIEGNYYDPNDGEQVKDLPRIKNDADFEKASKEKDFLVVEVGADYCPTCKALVPSVKSAAAKLKEHISFAQIDMDDDPQELIKSLDIKSIPVLFVFKKGKLLSRYDQKVFGKHELYMLLNSLVQAETENTETK